MPVTNRESAQLYKEHMQAKALNELYYKKYS